MASTTRKKPASPTITRKIFRPNGSVSKTTEYPYGYQTNPQTGDPSKGASGSIERVYREQKRVLDRARRNVKGK